MGLNDGRTNQNSTLPRIFTLFILNATNQEEAALNPFLPSIAESLAVLSSSLLIKSATKSTIRHYWNYSASGLNPGVYEPLKAKLRTQQYTSDQ